MSWRAWCPTPFGTCGHHISCPRENIERRCEDKCLPIVLKSLSKLIQGFRENIERWEFSPCNDNPMNDSYSNLKVLMIEQDMTAGGAVPVLPWSSLCQCPFHEGSTCFSVAFWSPPLSHGGRYHLGLHKHLGLEYFYRRVPSPTFPTGFLHSALY